MAALKASKSKEEKAKTIFKIAKIAAIVTGLLITFAGSVLYIYTSSALLSIPIGLVGLYVLIRASKLKPEG